MSNQGVIERVAKALDDLPSFQDYEDLATAALSALRAGDKLPGTGLVVGTKEPGSKFQWGQLVRKKSGSWWEGRVRGFYVTDDNPLGICVQLDRPHGPVQIYPESALEAISDD